VILIVHVPIGFDSTTYFQGYGATPFILRNGSGTDLVSIASSGTATFSSSIDAGGRIRSPRFVLPDSEGFFNDSGAKLVTGSNGSNPWTFFTVANSALGIKVGSLVVSSSYADTAPTNGLFVEGAATFNGNVGIGGAAQARLDVTDGYIRVKSGAGTLPASGKGLEMTFDAIGNIGYVFAVSRDGAGAYPLSLGPTANPLYIAAAGDVTVNGNVNCDTATYPQFALKLSGVSKGMLWYDSVNSRMTLGSGSTSNGMSLDASGNATFWGNINVATTAKLGDFTVATLPSASVYAGHECNVTDSSVTTFGSTVAGGGSSRVKLYSNGTNWTVQAA